MRAYWSEFLGKTCASSAVLPQTATSMSFFVFLTLTQGVPPLRKTTGLFQATFTTIRVKAFRIDELELENVSFIKIDVEGHELSVLEGASEMLRKNRPSILLEAEERHRERAVATVREFLEPLGYEGYMLEQGALVSIRSFDPTIHQTARAAQQRRSIARSADHYINNFIFLSTLSPWVQITACDKSADAFALGISKKALHLG